jgi:hypothetical protein
VLLERLETVEETRDLLTLREKPHLFIGLGFCVFSLLPVALLVRSPRIGLLGAVVPCAWFLFLGLYASVESTFLVSRAAGTLRVKRRLWWLVAEREYSLHEISRFFEWQSTKGNRLRMELLSGKKKSLTLFAEYSSLESEAAMLNHFLPAAKHSHHQPAPRDPLIH